MTKPNTSEKDCLNSVLVVYIQTLEETIELLDYDAFLYIKKNRPDQLKEYRIKHGKIR